jgi:hypothetical protein
MQQTYTPPGIFGKKWPGLDENGQIWKCRALEGYWNVFLSGFTRI